MLQCKFEQARNMSFKWKDKGRTSFLATVTTYLNLKILKEIFGSALVWGSGAETQSKFRDINDNHCHEHQNNLHQRIVQSGCNWQWRMETLPRMYIVVSHIWELYILKPLALSNCWCHVPVMVLMMVWNQIIQMGFPI
ncbi:hypothetical protein CY35_01G030100 [Sphagnum magellanicum]|nr:hypothetical protein CY35_01G030100 [Sphagnum magellanicum]